MQYKMQYKNTFKCRASLWKMFGWCGKSVYNQVYGVMIRNQSLFRFRGKSATVSLLTKEDWKTICHNAACQAGWAADKAADRLAA